MNIFKRKMKIKVSEESAQESIAYGQGVNMGREKCLDEVVSTLELMDKESNLSDVLKRIKRLRHDFNRK